MKKLVPIVIVALVAWFAYGKYEAQRQRDELSQASAETEMEAEAEDEAIEHSENSFQKRRRWNSPATVALTAPR